MNIELWIQFGLLFIALLALIFQQWRLFREQQKREKRIETKLRIFYILTNQNLNQGDIIEKYKGQSPTRNVKESEIRKAVYEMLTEETIYYQKGGTYRSHWRSHKTEASA